MLKVAYSDDAELITTVKSGQLTLHLKSFIAKAPGLVKWDLNFQEHLLLFCQRAATAKVSCKFKYLKSATVNYHEKKSHVSNSASLFNTK